MKHRVGIAIHCTTSGGKRQDIRPVRFVNKQLTREYGVVMAKSKQLSFHHLVTKILDDELNPRMGELKDASSEELLAHSAAYIHAACMIVYGLDIEKDFFKFMVQDTIDSVWSVEDLYRVSGPLH